MIRFLVACLLMLAALFLFFGGMGAGYLLGTVTGQHGGIGSPATATAQP